MARHHLVPAFVAFIIHLTLAMRAARLPRAASDSHLSYHDAYISQIVHTKPQILLNHEDWHKRKAVSSAESETDLSDDFEDMPALTTTVTLSVLPVPATLALMEASNSTISAKPTMISHAGGVALAMHEPQEAQRPSFNDSDWEAEIDTACALALSRSRANSTPSGMVPCYNIRTLTPLANISFEADLSIYQVSLMTGEWKGLQSEDMSVGVLFSNATAESVADGYDLRKRWTHEERQAGGDIWTGQGGQSWGAMRRRQGGLTKPRKISTLRLHGTINTNFSGTAQDAITPLVRLTASKHDGTSIVEEFENRDAFFVAGVFATQMTGRKSERGIKWPPDIRDVIREGNRLQGNQVLPLVVGCIGALLPAVMEGSSLWVRRKCRRDWRAKMRRGEGNGVVVVSYY